MVARYPAVALARPVDRLHRIVKMVFSAWVTDSVIIFVRENVGKDALWVGRARKCDSVADSELRSASRMKMIQWGVDSSVTPAMLATIVLLAFV